MEDFSIILDHNMNLLIETNIVVHIRVDSISGLAFVFAAAGPDALLVLFDDGGLNDVYITYSFFNSNTGIISHDSHNFFPFPSQVFPNLLTACMPSLVFSEVNMVRQELLWMMMTWLRDDKGHLSTDMNVRTVWSKMPKHEDSMHMAVT